MNLVDIDESDTEDGGSCCEIYWLKYTFDLHYFRFMICKIDNY
jgi:hypothetical protein